MFEGSNLGSFTASMSALEQSQRFHEGNKVTAGGAIVVMHGQVHVVDAHGFQGLLVVVGQATLAGRRTVGREKVGYKS